MNSTDEAIIVAIRVLIAAHPFGWIHHVAHIERMGCTGKQ
jgi:hypothetical protein